PTPHLYTLSLHDALPISGGRSRVIVRIASSIEPEWLLDLHPEGLRDETELVWEPSRQRVEVVSRLLYDQLALEETRRLPAEAERSEEHTSELQSLRHLVC